MPPASQQRPRCSRRRRHFALATLTLVTLALLVTPLHTHAESSATVGDSSHSAAVRSSAPAATTAPTDQVQPQQQQSSDDPLFSSTSEHLAAAEIERILQKAELARFGHLPGRKAASSKPVRPNIYSYPSYASLHHSVQADKRIHIDEATRLYEQAAALGSSRALNDLGEMHLVGDGSLQPDYRHAARFFNRSADLGNPEAQHHLAVMAHLGLTSRGHLDESLGIVQDYFAALGDNPLAKMSLGYRHLYGLGVPKSCETAVSYYAQVSELVVAQHVASPVHAPVDRARLADEKARQVAPEEDEDVIQYYQLAAARGDVHAQVALGHMHLYGARGYEQDPEVAARYLKAAAAQGDTGAMSSLGQMHTQGIGVSQNNATAYEYLSTAAEKGNAAAQNGVGYLYLHGQGVTKDYKKALKWFKRAAALGHPEAQFHLGAMYFAGLGVDKNYPTALQYFGHAGQQGHPRALFNLGQMHLTGLGTLRSCTLAVKLHKLVAEMGTWATVLNEAHRHFLKGRYDQAWILYARAAEEGYEIAQANSAWMLDQGLGFEAAMRAVESDEIEDGTVVRAAAGECDAQCRNLRYVLAHRHWRLAAQQGHIDALRMLGDYAFDGRITHGVPDYHAALKYYSQAAEHRNAQAMFNLGYMYAYGYGTPTGARDFHLAKRYYDRCLETDPNALVPVKLALAHMYVRLWWYGWGETTTTTATTATQSTPATTPTTDATKSPAAGGSSRSRNNPASDDAVPSFLPSWLVPRYRAARTIVREWIASVRNAQSWTEIFLEVEDLLLAVLCAAFAIIVYIRSR